MVVPCESLEFSAFWGESVRFRDVELSVSAGVFDSVSEQNLGFVTQYLVQLYVFVTQYRFQIWICVSVQGLILSFLRSILSACGFL